MASAGKIFYNAVRSDKDQLLKMMDAMLTLEYKRSVLHLSAQDIEELSILKNK